MLAAFARAIRPATEHVSTAAGNALARLAKRRDQLVLMRAQEKNRRSEVDDRAMAKRISRLIEVVDHGITEIEAEINVLIKAEPELSEDAQLMRSLPGVGPVTCIQLITQMQGNSGTSRSRQVAALAGLAAIKVDRRCLSRQAQDRRREKARPRRPLHGCPQRCPSRAPIQGFLHKVAAGRKASQTRPHCRRQKAPDHPQRHAPRQKTLHACPDNITVAGSRGACHRARVRGTRWLGRDDDGDTPDNDIAALTSLHPGVIPGQESL